MTHSIIYFFPNCEGLLGCDVGENHVQYLVLFSFPRKLGDIWDFHFLLCLFLADSTNCPYHIISIFIETICKRRNVDKWAVCSDGLGENDKQILFPPISPVCPWSSTDATPRLCNNGWDKECWVRLRINSLVGDIDIVQFAEMGNRAPGTGPGLGRYVVEGVRGDQWSQGDKETRRRMFSLLR